ncbi:MAG: heme exporter protein CcmD [Rhizobiaceae bacterium]
MTELFGSEYFFFVASAFGITAVVLLALTGWIVATYFSRKKQLLALERAGLKRASGSHV